jgi:hypothetical protein
MSIQQQLKDDYERTVAPNGTQAGAYDRFLRRRARYGMVMAGTSVTLLLALVVGVVIVPRMLADQRQPVLGPPSPAQQGQLVHRPEYGYELPVPIGWQVAAQDRSGELRLVPAAQPTHQASQAIIVGSTVLRPTQYPGTPAGIPVSSTISWAAASHTARSTARTRRGGAQTAGHSTSKGR